jgi:hypothetical protein
MSTNRRDLPRVYNIPGEGLVCEIYCNGQPLLFDRVGLESRIVQRRKTGLDTATEEQALQLLNEMQGDDGTGYRL